MSRVKRKPTGKKLFEMHACHIMLCLTDRLSDKTIIFIGTHRESLAFIKEDLERKNEKVKGKDERLIRKPEKYGLKGNVM